MPRRPLLQQLVDRDEIAEDFAHLLALDLQEKPLCINSSPSPQCRARSVIGQTRSRGGNTRSMPPPWMSNTVRLGLTPPTASPASSHSHRSAMAEHSMCQPGRPAATIPHGDGHAGSPGLEGFHSTKSIGPFL
jgi:hypothetical protein